MVAAQRPPLWQCLIVQLRVVHALLMRELITRFGRENLGVLWLVAEPMMFTLGVTAIWTLAGLHNGMRLPVVAFVVTGYSTILLWRNTTNRTAEAVEGNRTLLFHRRVRMIDVLIARIVLEEAGASASFMALGTLFTYVGWMAPPVDLLKVMEGWLLLGWFAAALALAIGSACVVSELVPRFWHPIAYFMLPFSGALAMVDWVPKAAQKYLLLSPMVHGTELIRDGWFGSAQRTHYDVPYMVVLCTALSLVALGLQERVSRRLE